ncbi:MAG: DPP IV N-terminal domain-containing protein [Saprospiraceae bacterium]
MRKTVNFYYQSAELAPIERHVFELDMNGQNKKVLTHLEVQISAQFSADYSYYVNTYSSIGHHPHTPYFPIIWNSSEP